MFASAQKAANARLAKPYAKNEILELTLQALPESYSLEQLYELFKVVEKQKTNDNLQNFLILHSCLADSSRLHREDQDEDSVTKILAWISENMLSTPEVVDHEDAPQDSTNASQHKAISTARRKGALGLQSLLVLLRLSPDLQPPPPISSALLISILAFTSPRDIWSTSTSITTAHQLLAIPSIQKALQAPEFISTVILQQFIRPLFSASRPSIVTAAGRKAMPSSAPTKRYDFNEERESKPWLYETVYTVTVLEWAVREVSTTTLSTTWPLILPPLLTLLDTPGTPLLLRTLPLISTILPKLPSRTLAQTGLASVFTDAIIPITLYLPTITPLSESLQILPLAWHALWVLYDVQFTQPALTSTSMPSASWEKTKPVPQLQALEKSRLAYLTALLRSSLLPASQHASSQPEILTILLTQLTTLLPHLGIHATKHIKDILPFTLSVLTGPFAGARLQDMRIALETFRVLCLCCWGRMGEVGWRREGVRGLLCAWGVVGKVVEGAEKEEGKGDGGVDWDLVETVKSELKVTGQVFVKSLEGKVDLRVELKPLLDVDEGIGELFGFEN